jgi:superfamily I DNA and/or RNA helicase
LVNLVNATNIDPAHIGIISPYKANVAILERWIERKPEYAVLKGISPPATVDSYQGHEADIMCVVLGTTKHTGPGFTRHANRLNVMLSRQKLVS